ncbi:MAG: ABC-2 family transporter protein [Oscillospiraceae bacterium]|nr:ABC-2 family transporter protein [Oscillospiraceae bacterium]
MLKEIKIYFKFIKMHILSGLEYKGWWMMCVQTVFIVITDPISVLLLFSRFGGIGEWTMERILLIYALAVASFGLAESFCRGFDYFPWKMIQSGDFDRLLLRPHSLFTQVAGSYFHLHRLPRPITGIIAVIWLLSRMNVPFSPLNFIILALALAGGVLTYTGVFIMTSGLAFFTIKGLDWIYIFTNASYQVTRCPIDYMPKLLKNAFTFFMPMLVISYYPASAVCGWGEPVFTGFLALPAGVAFLGFSVAIWKVGVRHYKSTGS